MEKKRVKEGNLYWYIGERSNGDLSVMSTTEMDCFQDLDRFENGNYFTDPDEAKLIERKICSIFGGAEVIDVPSGTEIVDAAEEHIEACDEDGCPYADVEDAKAAFGNGVEWLKSKIVK